MSLCPLVPRAPRSSPAGFLKRLSQASLSCPERVSARPSRGADRTIFPVSPNSVKNADASARGRPGRAEVPGPRPAGSELRGAQAASRESMASLRKTPLLLPCLFLAVPRCSLPRSPGTLSGHVSALATRSHLFLPPCSREAAACRAWQPFFSRQRRALLRRPTALHGGAAWRSGPRVPPAAPSADIGVAHCCHPCFPTMPCSGFLRDFFQVVLTSAMELSFHCISF